ncbi:malonyl-ACP O-methyltransferase BioC [Marinicellulosiphila megalodicopiae]|uniref:malonyl-ACP O-methyltransferase BioC n=1 Tax=Marinicellulosiphila megalodicopiae TaxID=2724896 RepID=UPI003BB063C9
MDKQKIALSFSNAATRYDQHAQFQRDVCDQLLSVFTKQFPKQDALSVLDIGCGTGYGVKQLNQQFDASIYAVDLAAKMVEFAKTNAPFAQYHCADAENLPFQTQQFDLVISSLALQWLSDINQAVSEIKRILTQDGQAWIATLAENTLFELKQSWQSVDDQTHVNQFHNIDMWQQACEQLDLNLDVIEQTQVLHYKSVLGLAKDLKGIGAHNVNQQKNTGLTGKQRFKDMQKHYEQFRDAEGLPATYQIIYIKISKK